jgi:hypothetical protein
METEIPAVQQERINRAKARSVMICTPVARTPAWQYTRSIVDTCEVLTCLGIKHVVRFVVGNSNLPRARNELTATFLASNYSDLLFIDDDMGWEPTAVLRLLSSDQKLIGGVGRMRVDKPNTDPSVWCWRPKLNERGELTQDEMGALWAEMVGTAFMRIERSVFRRIQMDSQIWKLPPLEAQTKEEGANYYRFFRFGNPAVEHEGEDFGFCELWEANGGSVWIDPTITLEHVGERSYKGCISEMLTAAAEADACQ